MGVNVEKAKVTRISKPKSPAQDMNRKNQLDNLEYFIYMGGFITNDARYPSEIKSRIALEKVTFTRKLTRSSEIGYKFN
jgi:hypothetical protein